MRVWDGKHMELSPVSIPLNFNPLRADQAKSLRLVPAQLLEEGTGGGSLAAHHATTDTSLSGVTLTRYTARICLPFSLLVRDGDSDSRATGLHLWLMEVELVTLLVLSSVLPR